MARLKHTQTTSSFSSSSSSQQGLVLFSNLLVWTFPLYMRKFLQWLRLWPWYLASPYFFFLWIHLASLLSFSLGWGNWPFIPLTVAFTLFFLVLFLFRQNIPFIEEIFKQDDMSPTPSFSYVSIIPTDAWTVGNKIQFLRCETPFSVAYKGKSTRLFPAEKTAGFRAGLRSQGKSSFENCP